MRGPHATLRYSDYCVLATQQRCLGWEQVQKQMYKIHQPHLPPATSRASSIPPPPTPTGQPDWRLAYTPGSKARSEYAAFMRQPGAEAAAALSPG